MSVQVINGPVSVGSGGVVLGTAISVDAPGALAVNKTINFNWIDNTHIQLNMRGADGNTKSGIFELA